MYEGKVAVVTGAANGIGRRLCEDLMARGAVVAAWDLAKDGLAALSAEAQKRGGECTTAVVDVTKTADVAAARDEIVKRYGRIDYWFNNAGIAPQGGYMETPPAEIDRVVAVNLGAVLTGTRLALEHMEHRGAGRVINMASVAGHVPAAYLTIYCATKHAVVGFTRSLREELIVRDSPVRLTLVSPGFVDTGMIARGKKLGFPEWLSWALATPEGVSREILNGVARGKDEIFPALNGRMMMRMHGVLPGVIRKSVRLLLVRELKDIALNRYTVD